MKLETKEKLYEFIANSSIIFIWVQVNQFALKQPPGSLKTGRKSFPSLLILEKLPL